MRTIAMICFFASLMFAALSGCGTSARRTSVAALDPTYQSMYRVLQSGEPVQCPDQQGLAEMDYTRHRIDRLERELGISTADPWEREISSDFYHLFDDCSRGWARP